MESQTSGDVLPLSPFRVGLIGCGAMGASHAEGIVGTPGLILAGLVDPEVRRMTGMAETFEVSADRCFATIEELLDRGNVDAVVVATQAPNHASVTCAAAARGVHVLCEKPMALDLTEADRMVEACDRAGVRLAINHLRRVDPVARYARQLIAEGAIGDVVAIDIHDKGGRPIGNTFMEMSTHYFDQARFLVGGLAAIGGRPADSVEWVFARLAIGLGERARSATIADAVPSRVAVPIDRDCGMVMGERGTVLVGFAGEVQAIARFLNRTENEPRYDGTDVIGTEGSLAVRGASVNALFRRHGHTFAAHDRWQPVEIPPEIADANDIAMSMSAFRCAQMLLELQAAAHSGREHISSGRDGRTALEIVMAAYRSHLSGSPVVLPLVERRHPLLAIAPVSAFNRG